MFLTDLYPERHIPTASGKAGYTREHGIQHDAVPCYIMQYNTQYSAIHFFFFFFFFFFFLVVVFIFFFFFVFFI